jgi:uncharacterized membrane protein
MINNYIMKKEVKKELKHSKKNKTHPIFYPPRTKGQKAADALTHWAGSWAFIIFFGIFLCIWMIINGYFLIQYELGKPWDPYPFILLNLVLSCLAAVQAPIILMSQNRQMEKDRIKAEYDYAVNIKAEREIREIQNLLMKKNKTSKI